MELLMGNKITASGFTGESQLNEPEQLMWVFAL